VVVAVVVVVVVVVVLLVVAVIKLKRPQGKCHRAVAVSPGKGRCCRTAESTSCQ